MRRLFLVFGLVAFPLLLLTFTEENPVDWESKIVSGQFLIVLAICLGWIFGPF